MSDTFPTCRACREGRCEDCGNLGSYCECCRNGARLEDDDE